MGPINPIGEAGIKKVQHKKDSTEPLIPQTLSNNTIKKPLVLLSTLFNKGHPMEYASLQPC